jgi:hypothetical protein
MTHIIISGVLALVFFGLIYALDRQTKHWQALHDKEIQAYKRDVGEQYTLYPEGYHSAGTTLSRLLLGSAIYFVIAVLLYFFA